MKEYQLSSNFYFRKLFKTFVQSLHFYEGFDPEKILVYPAASENFTTLDKTLVRGFL